MIVFFQVLHTNICLEIQALNISQLYRPLLVRDAQTNHKL